MSDVDVSLGLDDSKFTSRLNAADRQAKLFGANAAKSFTSMQTGLNSASAGLDQLNQKFDLMGKAILGVGITAFVNSLFSASRELKDLAASVDVSLARMMEMSTAATYAGSSMEQVGNMLSKMEIAAGQAAEGNEGLRNSFAGLGVSLNDMTRLSPDEAFNKIAVSLANITNPAERAAKATEIFGKTWKGINFNDYVENVTKLYGSMDKYAEAQKKANDVSEAMSLQMDLIRVATTNVLSPILDLATGTGTLEDKMGRAEKVATGLAIGLGLIAAAGVVSGVRSLAAAVTGVAGAMGLSSLATSAETKTLAANTIALLENNHLRNAGNLARVESLTASLAEDVARVKSVAGTAAETAAQATLEKTKWRLTAAKAALASTSAIEAAAIDGVAVSTTAAIAPTTGLAGAMATLNAAMVPIAAAATAIVGAGAGLQAIWNTFVEDKGGQNFLYDALTDTYNALFGTTEETKKATAATDENTKSTLTNADAIKTVVSELEKKVKATNDATANILLDNKLSKDKLDILARTSELGKTEADAQVARSEAIVKYKKEEQRILNEIADLKVKGANDKNANVGPAIAALESQLAVLRKIKDETYAQTKAEGKRQDKMAMAVMYIEMEKKAKDSMRSIELELADLNASETEKKLRNVDRLIDKEIELAIAKRQAQLGTNNPIAKSESDEIEAKIRKQYEGQKELTKELIKQKQAQELGLFTKKMEIDAANELNKIMDETATMTMTEIEKKYYSIGASARDAAKAAVEAEEARRGAKLDPQEVQAYYDAAYKGTEKLKAAQKASYDLSRTFATGWTKAMKQYVESATDASKTAAELFNKATKGMEDSIVKFAKTGKFEWKEFAADMLETLLRSQIQQTFAAMMGSMQNSAGGLMDIVGSLFGSPAQSQPSQASGGGDLLSSIFGSGSKSSGTPVFVTNWPGTGLSLGGLGSSLGGGLSDLLGNGTDIFGSSTNGGLFGGLSDIFSPSPAYSSPGFAGGDLFGGATDIFNTFSSGIDTFSDTVSGLTDYFVTQPSTSQYSDNYASRQGFGDSSIGIFDTLSSSIDSFTSGISDFFGGFFAGGGSLPAGKFGIVGEAGPELITGPASITPFGNSNGGNSGGVTNVYYTINANDAASFAQMLARDPSLIYALTQQGAKGMKA